MRSCRSFFLFPVFLLSTLNGFGQVEKQLDSLVNLADRYYIAGRFDSSLSAAVRALDLIKAQGAANGYLLSYSSPVSLQVGKCLKALNDLPKAHKYFTYALQLGRANQLSFDIENALIELNTLHQDILAGDLPFPYPSVPVTEEINMYFPIRSVERISADSIRVTVQAGRLDGITDSVKKAILVQRDSAGRKAWPEGRGLHCYVRELGANSMVLTATFDSLYPVAVRDLLYIPTMVPLSWRKLAIAPLVTQGIYFNNNYKVPIYHSRYLYYYADSLTNRDLTQVIKNQVDEVVEQYAKDTATDTKYLVKGDKGIFAGENVMRALARSSEEHIRLFTGFIKDYPLRYRGNRYKFSEIFATWVINNTPLAGEDLRPYLLGITAGAPRRLMCSNFAGDIRDRELINSWFAEGMQMAATDNTDSSQYMAELIRDACMALGDKAQLGWSDYLLGFTEKKLQHLARADSLFKTALQSFTRNKNSEGRIWAEHAVSNLRSGQEIKVSVQSGHMLAYIMAPSPNSKYLATAGRYDQYIKIWDMASGREIASLLAHDGEINSLHYSPDGRYLVSSSDDSTVKIWNAFDLSLLKTIRTRKPEWYAIFTPGSKQLVTGGKDSLVKIRDLGTGQVLQTLRLHKGAVSGLVFDPTDEDQLFSCGTDSMIYRWNIRSGKMLQWFPHTGKVMHLSVTPAADYLSSVSSDGYVNLWKLETLKNIFKARVNVLRQDGSGEFNPGRYAHPAFSPDGRILFFPLNADSLITYQIRTDRFRVYKRNSNESTWFDLAYSKDGSYMSCRMGPGGPLRVYNMTTWDFDNNYQTLFHQDIKTYQSIPLAVQFTRDDNQLVVVHDAISKIDLRNGSTQYVHAGYFPFLNTTILLDDSLIIEGDLDLPKLYFRNYRTGKLHRQFSLSNPTEKTEHFQLTADSNIIFLSGSMGSLAAWDTRREKLLYEKKIFPDREQGFYSLRYDRFRNKLYALSKGDAIYIIDPVQGVLADSIVNRDPTGIEPTARYLYVCGAGGFVYKYDAGTLKLVKKIKASRAGNDFEGMVMSPDCSQLVVQHTGLIAVISTQTDRVRYEIKDHDYANGLMCISHNGRMLAAGSFDSRVNLYDLVTGKRLAGIFVPRDKDFMLIGENNTYMAPKNTLEAIHFSYNNNNYGFEQFDIRFNRPDLVLKRINRADSSLIRSYHAAYQKRLKKMNIGEAAFTADLHLPVTRLKEKFAVRPATSLDVFELKAECFDAKYPLRSVQVLVNNNPLYGPTGKPIDSNRHIYTLTERVPLSSGPNSIKVFCTNSAGASSLAESVNITSNYPNKGKTYFIGIAVSSYKDSTMNLRYAAKDVRDLARSFNSLYKNFETDTLIDGQVTRENILALRKKLSGTAVNDKVIISVNGHGLLSDSLDFYYATWDMDFSSPARRGLKYEELEALLDGIPARKKLLLIDACHSGSMDKEELLALQKKKQAQPDPVIHNADTVRGFASRGTITRSNRARTDAGSAYELMQTLFADISSGNGTVVISAAGGLEYAFESDNWNNGVFTYCIRRGIEERQADRNGGNLDKLVDVAELKNYVSRKVSELTHGKQRPVSRRENIEYNWVIW